MGGAQLRTRAAAADSQAVQTLFQKQPKTLCCLYKLYRGARKLVEVHNYIVLASSIRQEQPQQWALKLKCHKKAASWQP